MCELKEEHHITTFLLKESISSYWIWTYMMHTLEKNFDVARTIIILKLQQEESKVF
jgi:hypothetical protein